MKCLVVGARGMLGRAVMAELGQQGIMHRGAARGPSRETGEAEWLEVDLSVRSSLDRISDVDVVLNCAAYTDVDGAESNEAAANAVNGIGVGWLAQRCAAIGATLLHYSTDYVFDGAGTTPYPVEHAMAPINAYGRSKACGEREIRESGCAHLILRTSWVYAPWGRNFVTAMAKLGRERERLRVVQDQRGRPTSAQALAKGTLRLVDANASGTLHFTDGGEATWFDLATHVVARVNPSCRVEPCTSAEFPRPALRPGYSVLDVSATQALIGAPEPWHEGVDAVVGRLLQIHRP